MKRHEQPLAISHQLSAISYQGSGASGSGPWLPVFRLFVLFLAALCVPCSVAAVAQETQSPLKVAATSSPTPDSRALNPDSRPPTPAAGVQDEMVPDYKKYEAGGFKDEPLAGYKNTLNYASIIFSVLFVCCLAFLGTRFLYGKGALGPPPAQRFLRILDRLVLQPQKTLYVIRAGEKVFLLGVGDQQITSLAELDGRTVPDTLDQQLPVTPFSSYLSALEPFSRMFRKKGKKTHPFIPLREEGNDAASHL